MLESIEKWEYRAKAGVPGAKEYLEARLADCVELPLLGLHHEKLYLTGFAELAEREQMVNFMYEDLPANRGVKDIILLDAFSSATIEGARTTVAKVKDSVHNPVNKDDKMVVNTLKGSNYAYKCEITENNIRNLWEIVVKDVCENESHKGKQYRDGMVYIRDLSRTIHTPAQPEQLEGLMKDWFAYRGSATEHPLIQSFVCHFYFVYVHPFCDGNGRTARIMNASQLYHEGFKKMKNLPLSTAINNQLSGYYSSLTESEHPVLSSDENWLDLSPFVSYMLECFERCIIDAQLSKNELTEKEKKLLTRMNKVGLKAEITSKKAKQILGCSESTVRRVLSGLVQKGYLSADTTKIPYIYRLEQHIPNENL